MCLGGPSLDIALCLVAMDMSLLFCRQWFGLQQYLFLATFRAYHAYRLCAMRNMQHMLRRRRAVGVTCLAALAIPNAPLGSNVPANLPPLTVRAPLSSIAGGP